MPLAFVGNLFLNKPSYKSPSIIHSRSAMSLTGAPKTCMLAHTLRLGIKEIKSSEGRSPTPEHILVDI